MAKIGRPTAMTLAVIEEICERLSQGEPLARICDDEHMPSFVTVWRCEDETFRKLSARAREFGTHYLADDCIRIADGPGEAADKRIRIDTRLRLIGKWNAKAYGERQTVEHTDPEGKNPFAGLMEAVASNGRPRPKAGD